MLPAISTAVSGLRAATVRLDASARTIANATSRAPGPAGSAAPPPAYLIVRVDQITQGTPVHPSAGSTLSPRNVSPAWMAAYETTTPAAESDLADAMLEQVEGKNAFIANARVLETAQAMIKQLFELKD